LINDLVANALGIATLAPEQFFTLNPGQPRPGGNQAQIAAGTGLGMAMLFQDGAGYRVSASEDGHMDFAPRREAQIALLRYLTARHGHGATSGWYRGPGWLTKRPSASRRWIYSSRPTARRRATWRSWPWPPAGSISAEASPPS